jgi:2-oxoglutarate dehydrogenase E2 component (dihydrolipoamide succinyltransferase)
MATEVRVPALPESVSDGVLVCWHRKPGEAIRRDEPLVDIETDKVVLEVPAPGDGILKEILIDDGTTVVADQLIGVIETGGTAQSAVETDEADSVPAVQQTPAESATDEALLSPAVRKLITEYALDPQQISGTGKAGRITKGDVLEYLAQQLQQPERRPEQAPPAMPAGPVEERPQKRVPMSRLRARVAERLLEVTRNTAMLTTFNELNMQPVMTLRNKHREAFEQSHGVRLGFMSFFVHAAAEALRRHPDINASIDGDDIVYHGFCDIGVAISTERGLVVPILRNAEYMSLADIESQVADFAARGRDGKLTMEEITGGTFSITNGGVFGSMLSTPILNPPQSSILGMHRIQDRAVVENGEVVVRPIMYLALTYDHRIVDGKSAVTFLKTIIDLLEDPASMLLGL